MLMILAPIATRMNVVIKRLFRAEVAPMIDDCADHTDYADHAECVDHPGIADHSDIR